MQHQPVKPLTSDIPAIPSDWLEHTTIQAPSGCVPHCEVLHKVGSEYVIHTAQVRGGEWCYERGAYYDSMSAAAKGWNIRTLGKQLA